MPQTLILSSAVRMFLCGTVRQLSGPSGGHIYPMLKPAYDPDPCIFSSQLWKFQQEKRTILENRDYYGLKRWEIGEIASKIGQLYYHYYLRTSETLYLQESFVFYDAIRARFYFKDVVDANSAPLMIKKLRYYARFVVVCLLLDRRDYVQELLEELRREVRNYDKKFSPPDSSEWHLVVSELAEFLKADEIMDVVGMGRVPALSLLQDLGGAAEPVRVQLQHAVLAGACESQIKFSELTLDIFRMLLTVEAPPAVDNTVRQNPHKHLLYRPSIGQLHVVLASISKDLPENAAVLLYVSADKMERRPDEQTLVPPEDVAAGGLMLSSRLPSEPLGANSAGAALYPHDLVSFTRRPFVLVADSPGSGSFLELKNVYGAPLLCLCSPASIPGGLKGPTEVGSLFTLFLHAPLHALWVALKGEQQLEKDDYEQAKAKLNEVISTIHKLLVKEGPETGSNLNPSLKLFMTDDLLCNMILRFIFFEAVAQLHSTFKANLAEHTPRSRPAMPGAVSADGELQAQIKELAKIMKDTQYVA